MIDQLGTEQNSTSLDAARSRRDHLAQQIVEVGARIRKRVADLRRQLDEGALG